MSVIFESLPQWPPSARKASCLQSHATSHNSVREPNIPSHEPMGGIPHLIHSTALKLCLCFFPSCEYSHHKRERIFYQCPHGLYATQWSLLIGDLHSYILLLESEKQLLGDCCICCRWWPEATKVTGWTNMFVKCGTNLKIRQTLFVFGQQAPWKCGWTLEDMTCACDSKLKKRFYLTMKRCSKSSHHMPGLQCLLHWP